MSKHIISFTMGDKVYSETIENNIQISELTPDEVMNALNRAVGKFAFYSSLRAEAKAVRAKAETDFKAWEAKAYADIQKNPQFTKATVKAIDAQIIIQNDKVWRGRQAKIRNAYKLTDTLYVLVQSFELMTKTLQSILAMQRQELQSVSNQGFARGSGDMLDEG